MGKKEAASQALEGTFDVNALRELMNGTKTADIVAALANSLESGWKLDAATAWIRIGRPVVDPPSNVSVIPTRRPRQHSANLRSRSSPALFDS
jgi:phage-related baseplate assembly protein